jgi:hypothetical protein
MKYFKISAEFGRKLNSAFFMQKNSAEEKSFRLKEIFQKVR